MLSGSFKKNQKDFSGKNDATKVKSTKSRVKEPKNEKKTVLYKRSFFRICLTNPPKYTKINLLLRRLYGRGDGEKPSMRKVRAF